MWFGLELTLDVGEEYLRECVLEINIFAAVANGCKVFNDE